MTRIIAKIFRYVCYILFRPIWWLERLVPRSKNIWVFGSWYGQKYSDNSKYVFEYVKNNYPSLKAVWITKNKYLLNKLKTNGIEAYLANSLQGAWYCLRAKYALLTSGVVDVNKYFLNGCKQIWLWHGMPLKKIGYSDENYQNKSYVRKGLSNIINPYDRIRPYSTITSSDFFVPFLSEAFKLDYDRIWRTGLPRCDSFYTNKQENYIKELRTKYTNSKILLYMPTFRMKSNRKGNLFNPFNKKYRFDEKEFSAFLERENIVFLYKPHFVDSNIKVKIDSDRFMFINDADFEDLYILLNSIDILATDYSSVYFDFLPSKKIIFLLTFDYEEYLANSRSHYFDMYNDMHGIFCNNWHDFYDNYSSNIVCKDLTVDLKKFALYLDGNCSKKVVEFIHKRSFS